MRYPPSLGVNCPVKLFIPNPHHKLLRFNNRPLHMKYATARLVFFQLATCVCVGGCMVSRDTV
jgi:hypothetical protein